MGCVIEATESLYVLHPHRSDGAGDWLCCRADITPERLPPRASGYADALRYADRRQRVGKAAARRPVVSIAATSMSKHRLMPTVMVIDRGGPICVTVGIIASAWKGLLQ